MFLPQQTISSPAYSEVKKTFLRSFYLVSCRFNLLLHFLTSRGAKIENTLIVSD